MGETPKTALHRFLTEATWSADQINERRLEVMNKCNQTKISRGFSLIVDDSGHRNSGNFTAGVGRQYIGEIGKTDNGNVIVTTHLYDGKLCTGQKKRKGLQKVTGKGFD